MTLKALSVNLLPLLRSNAKTQTAQIYSALTEEIKRCVNKLLFEKLKYFRLVTEG